MSLVWVICGAGRGVGKTTLAQSLCAALPASVYAKHGHGKTKPDKPGHFFHTLAEVDAFIARRARSREHKVIESNALARQGRGDITVFIDAPPGRTSFREDAAELRSLADLRVASGETLTAWRRALQGRGLSRATVAAVIDALAAQRGYLFGSAPDVRTKVWFDASGRRVFGSGLARLLEDVARLGTLRDAAKSSGMSYRYAWDLVRKSERHLGEVLLLRQAGGACGGRSVLSPEGLRMLRMFRRLNDEVISFADRRFKALFAVEKAHG